MKELESWLGISSALIRSVGVLRAPSVHIVPVFPAGIEAPIAYMSMLATGIWIFINWMICIVCLLCLCGLF